MGYNQKRCYNINCTIHAEMDAINKLRTLDKNNKLCKVNIIVIRVNNSGDLCSSKPCDKCMNYMKTIGVDKGYKINKIYYSTSSGVIEQMRL